MFEKALAEKFKKIFKVKKVSFDQPGESLEQECLFIEIESAKISIKDDRAKAMVNGNALINSTNEKLPFAYYSKNIAEASVDDTKDLFFYDFENNTRIYRDKVQRAFSFVYFFDSQYDPETGNITSIEFIEE